MFTEDISAEGSSPVVDAPHWSINVTADFVRLGDTHYHADLFLWEERVCRISLKRRVMSRAEAVRVLTQRCRFWITRQEGLPAAGSTDLEALPG